MTPCDLHVKDVTLTAGQRMERGARLDVKEQQEGRCSSVMAHACPWPFAKANEKS